MLICTAALWGGVPPFLINAIIGTLLILALSKKIKRSKLLEKLSAYSLPFYAFQNKLVIPIVAGGVGRLLGLVGLRIEMIEFVITFLITSICLYFISMIIERKFPWILHGFHMRRH